MYKVINADFKEVIKDIFNENKNKNIVIVTDPPFNIGYKYDNYKDKISEQEYYQILGGVLDLAPAVIIHYPEALHKLSIKAGQAPERVVSWVYNSNTPRQHRDIAFYNIKPDFTQVKQEYKNPNDKRIKKRIEEGKFAKLYDWFNVNQVKNVSKKHSHKCEMPLQVMENIVGTLPKDSLIIDIFSGTGTTGEAVLNLNKEGAKREYIGIEISPEYCEIQERRLNGENQY